jgi:hypothetical protein
MEVIWILMFWLSKTDWRGPLVVSPDPAQALKDSKREADPVLVEENVETDANTVGIRMTEFYGLSREDWLSLVIKVSHRTWRSTIRRI